MTFTTLCQDLKWLLAKPKTIMFMNLTAVLLLVGCLQVAAGGFSQNVTISRKDVPMEKVFREIKKQTGYSFFYKAGLLQNSSNVSIDVKNVPVGEIIAECLKGQDLDFSIVNKTIVIIPARRKISPGYAADSIFAFLDIHGEIRDSESEEMITGANINVKGSKLTVTSNANGQFSIIANVGDILTITYVGYESQEIKVKDPLFMRVFLKAKKKEEELIVTGYQELKRESYTGSPTVVTGDQLKMINPQNLLVSLQSFDPSFRVAENSLMGSNPNILPSISIRGTTALPGSSTDAISKANLVSATNTPAFFLDGYEVTLQKIYDLDMNRVKSITLLKDAAATAIYGSRAANGVVVITTKTPKNGKLQLTYNYDLTVNAPDLSQYKILDASQKLDYELLAGLYDAQVNKLLPQQELDELYYHKKKAVVGGVNTYWLSQPLRTALGHKHSIYIEGGDNFLRYGLALRYQTTPGVMKGSKRDRVSTEFSLSYSPNSRFQFRNTLSVTSMHTKESPYGDFSSYALANPYYQKTDSAGRIIQEIDRVNFRNKNGSSVDQLYVLNPLFNSTLGSFDKSSYIEIIDAFSTDWAISKSFRFKGVISLNKTATTSDKFTSPFSNSYYQSTKYKVGDRGQYDYSTLDGTVVDGFTTLTYFRQLGRSYINAMLGANVHTNFSDFRSIQATGFTNDRFSDIEFAKRYAKETTPNSDVLEDRLAGGFFSANYAFDNKYLVDFTFREDGSSKFGVDSKMAPFTSLGLGWNAHREAFMKGSSISRLKVRATAGITGSVEFSPYQAQTTYNYNGTDQYSTGIGATVNNYGNTMLKWQKTRNLDLGMELGFFKDRLVIMPRYYYKLTRGLVADVAIAPSTGFNVFKDNVGDMRNTGYELGLQANVIRSRDVNVSVNLNLVRNENIIVKVSNSLKAYNDRVDKLQTDSVFKGAPLSRYKEGQSNETIYAVRSLGIDPENGRELFLKKDGKTLTYDWDVRDIVPIGVKSPKGEGSFGAFANYKRFSVNLSFFTRFGGEQYNQTLVDRVENANPYYNVDARVFEGKWKSRGDYTFYKNISDLGTTEVTSRFVQKDNLLELRSVFLSYDVDKSFYSKIGATSLRLAFTMNDAWRWSSIKEERGIEYPYARSFNVSLQAGF